MEDGTLKGCSLGVSNFRPVDLEEVMRVAKIKPVVNRGSSFSPSFPPVLGPLRTRQLWYPLNLLTFVLPPSSVPSLSYATSDILLKIQPGAPGPSPIFPPRPLRP